MDYYQEVLLAFSPWGVFIIFALLAKKLLNSANKRRGMAVAFGVLVQMFLPDPQIQKTIETVIIQKQVVGKKQNAEDDPEKN